MNKVISDKNFELAIETTFIAHDADEDFTFQFYGVFRDDLEEMAGWNSFKPFKMPCYEGTVYADYIPITVVSKECYNNQNYCVDILKNRYKII